MSKTVSNVETKGSDAISMMRSIRDFEVPEGSVAAWWLGQSGYIFKTPEGTLLSVDLYLSNSVPELLPHLPINAQRMQPIFLAPAELETDVFACTHSHFDHADPLTITNLSNREAMQFVGPHKTCRKFLEYGVPASNITEMAPGQEFQFRDIHIRAAFALPTDTSDLTHLGFVFTFAAGPKIYFTGDTDHSELLRSVAAYEPDAMIVCINGNFNNLSHWEAAEVAKWVSPKVAIPCHYDMFPDNAIDPLQFRASLKIRAPEVAYREFTHAVPEVLRF